jgi:hypothetical protein
LWNEWRYGTGGLGSRLSSSLALQVPFICGAAIPIALFLTRYAAVDGGLSSFYRGVFVLPSLRLTFASYSLPKPWTLLPALPFALALGAVFVRKTPVSRALVAPVGGALALVLVLGFEPSVYQSVWFSLRPIVPCVVVLGCLLLNRGTVTGTLPGPTPATSVRWM